MSLVAFSLVIVLWSNTLNPPTRLGGTFRSVEAEAVVLVVQREQKRLLGTPVHSILQLRPLFVGLSNQ